MHSMPFGYRDDDDDQSSGTNGRTMCLGVGKVVGYCAIATAQDNGYVQWQRQQQEHARRHEDCLYMAKAAELLIVVG